MRPRPTPCVSTIIATAILLGVSPVTSAQKCEPHWNTTAPLIGDPGLDSSVFAMTVFDDGTGPALYAGGSFITAGGVEANGVAKWDGSSWNSLGTLADNNGNPANVYALAVFDDGSGPALYAGGGFVEIGGVFTIAIAKWDGSSWNSFGSGNGLRSPGFPSIVNDLVVFDDGSGPALYVGGGFLHAGGLVANSIAKWDGTTWTTLDSGISGIVVALEVFDDGTGSALYAGGLFIDKPGLPNSGITKWDGSSFSEVGGGITSSSGAAPQVFALDVFDDGSGPALYAAGLFTAAGGVEASSIAKWDGSSWSALGNVVSHSRLFALTVFDDGSGPALYVGGTRITAGNAVDNPVARWNGSSWSALGTGVTGAQFTAVEDLAVFDDGTGPSLYVGGGFVFAGGERSNSIAEWVGCAESTPGDVNGDGVVNGADLASLLTGWGACPSTGACPDDLTKDGVVNAADLATLLANWG